LHASGGTGILAHARSLNAATLLGRAVLLNMTQPTLTMATAGLRPTLRALPLMARDAAESIFSAATGTRRGPARQMSEDFALRIGAALDGALNDYIRFDLAGGPTGRLANEVLRRTGFLGVERFNRRFASAIAREWYTDLIRDGSPRALRQLRR